MIRFNKATRANGVDGQFEFNNPRVTVQPTELPTPLYPEDPGFWIQFQAVLDSVTKAKENSKLTLGVSSALEPIILRSALNAAEIVHNDLPTEIMLHGFRAIQNKVWRDIGLLGGFTDKVVLLNNVMSFAAHAVSANSFCAKWHWMVPRPEEVAGAIARDEIEAPDDIVLQLFDCYNRPTLASQQKSFTTYPEGCPGHPSYNAMHSAAAGAGALALKVMMDLNEDDMNMINLTARNMAYFRTVAGVHYPQDNAVGLWLGEETVARVLPNFLADNYGVDPVLIDVIISSNRFGWL